LPDIELAVSNVRLIGAAKSSHIIEGYMKDSLIVNK
jgi:hypothetical protein